MNLRVLLLILCFQSSRDTSSPLARSLETVTSPRHMAKSPLAQVKEKSKGKRSVRGQDKGMERSNAVDVEVVADDDVDDADTMHDRIEKKWREVRVVC